MMNQKRSRLLITLVLAAAMVTAIGSEAFAAGGMRSLSDRTSLTSGMSSRPGIRPMTGEPDVPQNGTPLPPKVGNASMGVGQLSPWLLRFQWSVRVLLNQLPRRLP